MHNEQNKGMKEKGSEELKLKDKIIVVTKVLLDVMFYAGIMVCISLPISIKFYGKFNSYFKNNYVPLCFIFFFSGIFAVAIIQELRKMFRSVIRDDCFIRENVISLNRMGNYSFAIAFVTVFRVFLYITPAVFVIILVFIIAALFSKVLSHVFDKAVTYKLENDLTI
ncbi:MAG: DUF2975 domain-containing protein [Lachnospiraceae bacterium]|nr:DUF2975 domain-containing protein [Lachnospiraceae bacterium]